MSKIIFFLSLLLISWTAAQAQVQNDSTEMEQIDTLTHPTDTVNNSINTFKPVKVNDNQNCYYHINPIVDVPIAVIGVIGTPLGFYLINKKPPTPDSVILNLNPETDIKLAINRKDIHNYDPNLKHISDYFLYGSFAYGFVLLLDPKIRPDAAKIGLMYLETMGLTGASYALTAASVDKLRPYAYNTDSEVVQINGIDSLVPVVPLSVRASTHAKNSFYGGHPSAPAASCLFVANIYSVYHPHSPFRFVLYGVAVAATGATCYLRYEGGYHFPTDLAIGIGIGTAYGMLFTRFHRCKNVSGLSVTPITGQVNGFNLLYRF